MTQTPAERTYKVWKISKREYDRIKHLNNNRFFTRKGFAFNGKYYEHDIDMPISAIYRWQRAVKQEQARQEAMLVKLDI
jgi:hypothetical protein